VTLNPWNIGDLEVRCRDNDDFHVREGITKMQNAKCKMQNAKCKMQNAKCKMQSAKWKMINSKMDGE
jgi:hypothetical protein